MILNGDRSTAVSNKYMSLTVLLPPPITFEFTHNASLFAEKLQTVPSGSFHLLPKSRSNPQMLMLATPVSTSVRVTGFSPGSHNEIFSVEQSLIIPSIPVHFSSWWPDFVSRWFYFWLVTPVLLYLSRNLHKPSAALPEFWYGLRLFPREPWYW